MSDEDAPGLSPGKQVLLRALDNIEEIEEESGGSVEYLAVIYAVEAKGEGDDIITTRGWDATKHPHFVLTGLMREVACKIEQEAVIPDDEEDE